MKIQEVAALANSMTLRSHMPLGASSQRAGWLVSMGGSGIHSGSPEKCFVKEVGEVGT